MLASYIGAAVRNSVYQVCFLLLYVFTCHFGHVI